MTFLQSEKRRQARWKLNTQHLSPEAKMPGIYAGKPRPFCLPIHYAQENLFEPIRSETLDYFTKHRIVWHCGTSPGNPTNHLCSSQVFTINLLAPFQRAPTALATFLKPALPDIERILPIESQGNFLSFEWIPPTDLLLEARCSGAFRKRCRGIGVTSIDFTLIVRTRDRQTVMILGETKYTEQYHRSTVSSEKVTKCLAPYLGLLSDISWPHPNETKDLAPLATEPMYQLFRHHVLACKIARHYAEKIDEVRLLHLYIDRKTTDSCRGFQSPVFQTHNGFSLFQTSPVPFAECNIALLVRRFPVDQILNFRSWREYMSERYQL